MENLNAEGKAIYDTQSMAHEKHKAELDDRVIADVNRAVDSAIERTPSPVIGKL
jgi:hypothetical protein